MEEGKKKQPTKLKKTLPHLHWNKCNFAPIFWKSELGATNTKEEDRQNQFDRNFLK